MLGSLVVLKALTFAPTGGIFAAATTSLPEQLGGVRNWTVYGELMDALHQAKIHGLDPDPSAWSLQRALLDSLEGSWREADEGIWETRGDDRRHFVHSKGMAWVAFDRAAQAAKRFGLDGPVGRWRAQRDAIRAEVLREGYDAQRGTFTQSYGSRALDGSLLMIPLVGLRPVTDARMRGTIDAITQELCSDGLVLRYRTERSGDGLPAGEGAFLP